MRAALIVLASLLLALPAQAQEVDKDELMSQLRSRDAARRAKGYAAIDGPGKRYAGSAYKLISTLLVEDIERAGKARARLAKPLEDLLSKRQRKTLSKQIAAWRKTAAAAAAAVADTTAYPSPGPTTVIRGPWKGASKVMKLIKLAEKQLQPILALAKATDDWGGAARLEKDLAELAAIEARIEERHKALDARGRRTPKLEATPPGLLALARASALLDAEEPKPAEAFALIKPLEAPERTLFFVIYGRAIDRQNRKVEDTGLSKASWAALEQLSRRRTALGLLPLEVDARLCKAVLDHCKEMAAKRYFSHFSPTPGRQHPADRAKLAGWTGAVHENLATGTLAIAMWNWFFDGGHGRNLTDERLTWIGAAHVGGARGFCGTHTGYGVDNRWPRPELLPPLDDEK